MGGFCVWNLQNSIKSHSWQSVDFNGLNAEGGKEALKRLHGGPLEEGGDVLAEPC